MTDTPPIATHTRPAWDTIDHAITALPTDQHLVTICTACEVDYTGRAESYLGPGDRLIVCKPDGALLVHKPTGHEPVNWQPPGGTFTTRQDDGEWILEARRSDPPESVTIYLNTVYSLTVYAAADDASLELTGTELDLHNYILDEPAVIEDGLRPVEHERDTPAGDIDIFAYDETGRPVLIEVKRRQAALKHVDQLTRYMRQYEPTNDEARGILVAPAASDDVKRELADRDLEFVALAPDDITTTSPTSDAALSDFS